MKATILVRDLVKLIANHGDLDVRVAVDVKNNSAIEAKAFSVDEVSTEEGSPVNAFEIYGEEQ